MESISVTIANTWRPMETAPRDGTYFLGARPVLQASRSDCGRNDIDIIHFSGWGGGVWEGARGYAKYELNEIKGWMPLPPQLVGYHEWVQETNEMRFVRTA